MNSETSEPTILEAEWDLEQVDALFDDLQQGAEIQHVQVRCISDGRPVDRSVTLRESQELIHRGTAKAIQIRYRFDEQSWCDTLMVRPSTVRIIRTSIADRFGAE